MAVFSKKELAMKTIISWFLSAIIAHVTKFDFFSVLSTVTSIVDIGVAIIKRLRINHTDDKNALH